MQLHLPSTPVILTWCLVCLPAIKAVRQSIDDDEHLCAKVMSGAFEALQLKSITYFTMETLIIFEGNQKYYIALNSMSTGKLTIPRKSYRWDKEELAGLLAKMGVNHQSEEPVAVYMFALGNPNGPLLTDIFSDHSSKKTKRFSLNVVMSDAEYLADIRGWLRRVANYPRVEWTSKGREHPDYAITARQEAFSEPNAHEHSTYPEGYVLHSDQFHQTNQFVIYDLVIHHHTLRMDIQKLPEIAGDDSAYEYHYLQRTNNSDEVLLRYKDHIGGFNESKWSLFRRLPVGYRYKKFTYLLDSDLGCVYRLQLEKKLLSAADHQSSFIVKRVNIPFEKFFTCDRSKWPLQKDLPEKYPADRCETNYLGYSGPSILKEPDWQKPERYPKEKEDSPDEGGFQYPQLMLIMGAVLIGVLVLLGVIVLCVNLCRGGGGNAPVKNKPQQQRRLIPNKWNHNGAYSSQSTGSDPVGSQYLPSESIDSNHNAEPPPPPKKKQRKMPTRKNKSEVSDMPKFIRQISSVPERRSVHKKDDKLPTTSVFKPKVEAAEEEKERKRRMTKKVNNDKKSPVTTLSQMMYNS